MHHHSAPLPVPMPSATPLQVASSRPAHPSVLHRVPPLYELAREGTQLPGPLCSALARAYDFQVKKLKCESFAKLMNMNFE